MLVGAETETTGSAGVHVTVAAGEAGAAQAVMKNTSMRQTEKLILVFIVVLL
jgi:hypothetical protein